MNGDANDTAIVTRSLSRRFGRLRVLDGVDLEVRRGSVYGFLGRNGAGKTTTILILLGLERRDGGEIEVLGLRPEKAAAAIRLRIGYVPEKPSFPDWMTVGEVLRFTAPFYPTWDERLCRDLVQALQLPPERTIKHLSRGMLAKVALTLALAHRPELLILDDPTMGLDAVVRREFLETIISLIQSGERTVFFSSHLMEEVERVADTVGILHDGRIVRQESIDSLKASHALVEVILERPIPADPPAIPGARSVIRTDNRLMITFDRFREESLEAIRPWGIRQLNHRDLSLEDIFVLQTSPPGISTPASAIAALPLGDEDAGE